MKKCLAVIVACSLILPLGAPLRAETLTLPAGTTVIVKLLDTVSSATNKKGDSVPLAVVSDVIYQGTTVITAGTPVKGTVESAAKRFIAGIGGQIEISVNEVKAVDGTAVPLQFSKESHNGSTLVAAVVAVLCCCCAWLIPGKDVSIDKGTLFDAVTLSPVELHLSGSH